MVIDTAAIAVEKINETTVFTAWHRKVDDVDKDNVYAAKP